MLLMPDDPDRNEFMDVPYGPDHKNYVELLKRFSKYEKNNDDAHLAIISKVDEIKDNVDTALQRMITVSSSQYAAVMVSLGQQHKDSIAQIRHTGALEIARIKHDTDKRIKVIETCIKTTDEILKGNGKPGLVQKVANLDDKYNIITKLVMLVGASALITLITGMVLAVVFGG